MKISAVLLAGGKGTRMGSALPKQYLMLEEKPMACHSLEVLRAHPAIEQIIIVCDPEYRAFFSAYTVDFAEPGERRQDSLFNGLQLVEGDWVCVHDAARPYLTKDLLSRLIEEGKKTGAATLAMPVKNTIKESDVDGLVLSTPDRRYLWEVQTPQLLTKKILEQGFAFAQQHHLTVTDDVSLAELINHPVKLVPGSYQNLKITTVEDLCLPTSSPFPTTAPTT